MSLQGRILILLTALALIVLIINLVRIQKLHAGIAILWLGATLTLMLLVSFPPLLDFVTAATGATFPASALSLLAFVFIFLVLILVSVQLSRLSVRQAEIAQYLAIKEAAEVQTQRPETRRS
jgi:hypothetical protein